MKAVLISGIIAIVGVWCVEFIKGHVNPIDRIAYPTMIAIFAICSVLLQLRPQVLGIVESLTISTYAAYCFIYLQGIIWGLPFVVIDLYTVASFLQWLPILYVSAFILLEIPNAIIASVLFYLSILCSCILFWITKSSANDISNKVSSTLTGVCFTHPIYIVLLFGIALLKQQLVQTNTHADNMTVVATTDYLTGITSRRFASQSLDHLLEVAKTENSYLTIFILDIDHFKCVNDNYGHDMGDRVLITLANFLRNNLRSSDILGRWGGEEFIAILPKTEAQTAIHLAERLRERNAELIHEKVGHVTFSIGIATARPEDTTDSLFKRADASLYQAKQNGRNRFEIAA